MPRLIFLFLLFLASLLMLISAPAYYLWLLAVMVGEYGLLFIAATLVILTSGGLIKSKYNIVGTFTGILALGMFMSPIIRAYLISRQLPSNIEKELNLQTDHRVEPFTFSKLFQKDATLNYKTFTYANYPDISLTLDFYAAQTKVKRPCVIVIHGGSWSSGDSQQLPELNTVLAGKGYQVASINYRLAPKWHNPAPVEDVRAALIYLKKHADELRIDTNNFVLVGRSAGAQIALLAAYTLKEPGIKGVIDFYGPADMVWGYSLPAPKLVMDSRRVMANYLGGYYPQVPQNYKASSPVEFVNAQTVPTLIIHGANDPLVAYDHSRRLSDKLQQYHIPHYWLKLPWATHGFDHHLNGPGGQLSTYAVERFLERVAPVKGAN
ncbi:alpha/beta hydrolase [Mucilaginibacter terrae]|uniref:Acetyl esterase/lipase n=1 Tax=Mucilaginibacter terrae TaxID=1955052 RepID=A0ABU3GPT7_9SPHI|nr:alpha/beta hydrolase [Mucilaginibacter terrae]MDT3401794.1 acetyl esterase/lipase [Mucilaginibacter terrae]